jgi:hypothetical protein
VGSTASEPAGQEDEISVAHSVLKASNVALTATFFIAVFSVLVAKTGRQSFPAKHPTKILQHGALSVKTHVIRCSMSGIQAFVADLGEVVGETLGGNHGKRRKHARNQARHKAMRPNIGQNVTSMRSLL